MIKDQVKYYNLFEKFLTRDCDDSDLKEMLALEVKYENLWKLKELTDYRPDEYELEVSFLPVFCHNRILKKYYKHIDSENYIFDGYRQKSEALEIKEEEFLENNN